MNLTKMILFPRFEPWLKLAEKRVREKRLRIYLDGPQNIRAIMINTQEDHNISEIRSSFSASMDDTNEITAKCTCHHFDLSEGCEHLAALALSLNGSVFEASLQNLKSIHLRDELPQKPQYQESNLTLEWLALLKKDLRFQKNSQDQVASPIEIWYGLDFSSPGPTPQRFDQPLFLYMREIEGRDKEKLKVFQVTDENISRVRSREDLRIISLLRNLMPTTLSPYWRQRLGKSRRSLCFLPQDGLWQHLLQLSTIQRLFNNQYFVSQPGLPPTLSAISSTRKSLSFHMEELKEKNGCIQIHLDLPIHDSKAHLDIERELALTDNELHSIHRPALPMTLQFLLKEKLILGPESIDQLKTILRADPWLLNYFRPPQVLQKLGLDLNRLEFNPIIRLEISKQPLGLEIIGTLYFHYPKAPTPLVAPRYFQQDINEFDDWYQNGVILTRDVEAEDLCLQRINQLGLQYYNDKNQFSFVIHQEDFFDSITRFQELEMTVLIDDKKIHAAKNIRTSVKSQDDWFELKTNAQFVDSGASIFEVGGEELLENILDHPWRELGIVPLKNGKLGVMASDWLERLTTLSSVTHLEHGHLRIHTSQAFALELALEEERDKLENLSWGELKERARQTLHPDQIILSKSLKAELRPYQKDALAWFLYLSELKLGGILADDMGLGKTLQTLSFLEQERQRFNKDVNGSNLNMVVVPRTLMTNWEREAQKFVPDLKLIIYDGTPQKRAEIRDSIKKENYFCLILCTYGTLRLDVLELKNMNFLHLIFDEAHLLKNPDTLLYKSAQLIKAQSRFALSGTPAQNRLQELTTLLRLLVPKIFARKMPLDSLDQADELTRSKILKACSAFILRRTKEEVLKDLPQKIESNLDIELPEDHLKFYLALKKSIQQQFRPDLDNNKRVKAQIHPLEALLRLRQAAIHPKLVDPKYSGSSGKFLSLLDRLEEIIHTHSKALIFSQFTQALELLREQLNQRNIKSLLLTGKTQNRQKVIDQFTQDDEFPLFLLSLKAGGVGLNLTQANYIFILDPWWNPSQEDQAIDRSHRLGQEKTVFSYKMISKHTIEEKVQKLQKNKTYLIDQIQGKSDFNPNDHLELMNLFMD
jgi:SNF2 family DNA or RNA helicase